MTTFFGFDHPARIMAIMFASMPLAWLGTKVEEMLRERERDSYNQLLNWARNPDSSHKPTALVVRSLGRTFFASLISFYIAIIILKFIIGSIVAVYPGFLTSIDITWAQLWIAATLGGLMALRLKRVYAILGTGIILFVVFILWTRF